MNYYIAQVIAAIGFLILLLSFWQKKKTKILFFQVISSLFYAMQYLLLLAFSGAAVNIIGVIRDILFRNKNIKRKILYFFLIIYVAVGIFFWQGYLSLLPILASLMYTIVIYQKRENDIRKGSLLVSLIWIIYNLSVNAHVALVTESILLISNVLAILNYRKR